MKDFAGKVCAVTGAASGIGRALACELARRGARLALSDVDAAGLAETARLTSALGARDTRTDVVDVADRHAVQTWADAVAGHFGTVNLVVNNAGVSLTASVEETTWEDFTWLMGVNFWGVAHGTKAFLPHLRRAREAHLVNVSSVFGLVGVPTQSAYCAAKFAVRGFSESLRHEMRGARTGIGVTTVHPGGIRTDIVRNSRVAQGTSVADVVSAHDRVSITSADRAARIILRGVARGRSRVFVGPDATVIDVGQRLLGAAMEPVVRRLAGRSLPPRPGARAAGAAETARGPRALAAAAGAPSPVPAPAAVPRPAEPPAKEHT